MRSTPLLASLLLTAVALVPAAVADGHTGVEPCEEGFALVVDGDTVHCFETRATVDFCDDGVTVTVGHDDLVTCYVPPGPDDVFRIESCNGGDGFRYVILDGARTSPCFVMA